MAKKSKKAKRGTSARTKKRMKATRKKKPVPKARGSSRPIGLGGLRRREEGKETGAKACVPSGRPIGLEGLRWQDRRSLGHHGRFEGKANIAPASQKVR
jgi:hypothetical protein